MPATEALGKSSPLPAVTARRQHFSCARRSRSHCIWRAKCTEETVASLLLPLEVGTRDNSRVVLFSAGHCGIPLCGLPPTHCLLPSRSGGALCPIVGGYPVGDQRPGSFWAA